MPTDFARDAHGFPCPQWWGESGLFDPGTGSDGQLRRLLEYME